MKKFIKSGKYDEDIDDFESNSPNLGVGFSEPLLINKEDGTIYTRNGFNDFLKSGEVEGFESYVSNNDSEFIEIAGSEIFKHDFGYVFTLVEGGLKELSEKYASEVPAEGKPFPIKNGFAYNLLSEEETDASYDFFVDDFSLGMHDGFYCAINPSIGIRFDVVIDPDYFNIYSNESVRSSRNMNFNKKILKSSYEEDFEDAFKVYPWNIDNVDYHSDQDLGLSAVVEMYGDEFVNVDDNTLNEMRDTLELYFDVDAYVRDWNINNPDDHIESIDDLGMSVEDFDVNDLAMYFDYDQYGRTIRLEQHMVWDKAHECWVSLADINDFELTEEEDNNLVELSNSRRNNMKRRNNMRKSIKSRRAIKSAESYGWVVDSSDASRALEMWIEAVGEEQAYKDVVDTLSYDELAEAMAYIFRMNDFREWDNEDEDDDEIESGCHGRSKKKGKKSVKSGIDFDEAEDAADIGYDDFKHGEHDNPFDPDEEPDLYDGWEAGYEKAKKESDF